MSANCGKLYTPRMDNSTETLFYPIRKVTERTGVGGSTLRAWERRYGLLKPRRTPKGHRLYSEGDIALIMRVMELLDDGHAISEVSRRVLDGNGVAETSDAVVANAVPGVPGPGAKKPPRSGQWKDYLDRLLRAVEAFSPQRLDAVYNEASSLYPMDLVSQNLVEPALVELGSRWKFNHLSIAEEHFFSAWLRNKLGARLHHEAARSTGVSLVIACVPGHRHELGVLLFALAALGRGYRIVYLGIDMPLEPIPEVVERSGARGIILAGGREDDPEATVAGLKSLASNVSCPVFVGGPICHRSEQSLISAGTLPIGEQFALALHLVTSRLPVHGPSAA